MPSDYFSDTGVPKDSAIFRSIPISEYGKLLLNDEVLINSKIDRKKCFYDNKNKFFSLKYKKRIINNFFYSNKIDVVYLECLHYSRPLIKAAFEEGWKLFEQELLQTMKNRYRTSNDNTFCVFRRLNMYNGNFVPVNNEYQHKLTDINKNIESICKNIRHRSVREIVINDSICNDYEGRMKKVVEAFDSILPEKSSFEL